MTETKKTYLSLPVRVHQLAPDACRVTNTGSAPITGFTLAVKCPARRSVVGAKELRQRRVGEDQMVSMDLDPRESVDVRIESGPGRTDEQRR